ncbi:unnamed protein product [Didymodactylos carnosus]|uniref:Isopenicillin N synthase-like Fe(2+) 2OG dioxygenase domain-containing protein n=1 Tax=Didymodactylos carnosus TaxID=1234261 RepID=A0A814N5I1_9BILA|nr:unnamed protein product [Didymodactylos carnosus]CAF1085818.1 unnamed protein product [Didymodactylos carnosus]CAF3751625.1 unnamed protein product [Didymodactylos carnosus]CAF3851387.1 unnamed protein product [Didymodactylos carnosus]
MAASDVFQNHINGSIDKGEFCSQQIVIDLNKILNSHDSTELQKMQLEFETNGWCFVLLPPELSPQETLINELTQFFGSGVHAKSRHIGRQSTYGYSHVVDHKEGIKLLTGSYYEKFANKGLIPKTLIQPLNYLSQMFDAVTKHLVEILEQNSVFKQQFQDLSSSLVERANLPWAEEYFGMLDVVLYFNKQSGFQPPEIGQTTAEVNCVPHYDPGLLSISVLSTHEGLQLKNLISNQWVNGPVQPNVGVIWLGEAASRATNNRLKPGIHRVVYPQESNQRLTIWYELCTIEQLKSMSITGKHEKMAPGTVVFDNLPGSEPIRVLPDESKLDFLKRIESSRGLSMSKSKPPRYKLDKHVVSYPTPIKKE